MNDEIKSDILKSFEQECDHISQIDVPDYRTSAKFRSGMSKILNKTAKNQRKMSLLMTKLHRNQANKKGLSTEDITVRPQYVRLEPFKFPFKKAAIAAAAVVCVAAAGIFMQVNNKPQTSSPNDSGVSSGNNSSLNSKGIENLEKLTDNVYVGYDRTKYENVSAPPIYYAECIKPDDSVLASFFSAPPTTTYDDDGYRYFKNDDETGYYSSHCGVFYGSKDWENIRIASEYCLIESLSSIKDLDFMPLSELYKRFEEDAHKFIDSDNVEICEMTAVTAEEFAKAAALTSPSDRKKGWGEPKDVYYIRARQFVNGIPIFTGWSQTKGETGHHDGARIEACYTKDGLEYLSIIGGYKIDEEKNAHREFIDLKGAEQIIRDHYEMPHGYDRLILSDCDLVYVAVFEGVETILTPAWEFYTDSGKTLWYNYPRIRINAYTGEFMQ